MSSSSRYRGYQSVPSIQCYGVDVYCGSNVVCVVLTSGRKKHQPVDDVWVGPRGYRLCSSPDAMDCR